MRFSPHAATAALVAALAFAPAASAAPLDSTDTDPLISLDDTDVGALDWSIQANPGGDDGLSFFRSGSAAAILTLGETGNVGLGTATPLFDLHINTNDTPGVRLEQNNTGGFTAQTWDVAGNEANFFVRDLTGGSRLPFRIRPGAPTSSIDINAAGNVGIGTDSPAAALEVARVAPPSLFLTNRATNGVDWEVAAGSNLVLKTQTGAPALTLTPTGTATATATLEQNADVTVLENRADADPAAVLTAVTNLPIGYFEYAADPANVRHLAPLGSDFRAALGLGASDAALAPGDLGGVALVAIKGLAANDATFATKAQLAAVEGKIATLPTIVPSLDPVNRQLAALVTTDTAAKKKITALQKKNKSLTSRLSKLEKTVKALSRKR